ncbi:MAG: virulence RhuM family protein, partial [Sediminibacterium sp.]|nr:virulence RhuM family protein [Sediminibacterium sp.]
MTNNKSIISGEASSLDKGGIVLQKAPFLLYEINEKKVFVDVYFKDENIWMTQDLMAQLFEIQRPAITKHLINIFNEQELLEDAVSSILEHTASDGKKYKTKFYNLDAIISVGYRVSSTKATKFR